MPKKKAAANPKRKLLPVPVPNSRFVGTIIIAIICIVVFLIYYAGRPWL